MYPMGMGRMGYVLSELYQDVEHQLYDVTDITIRSANNWGLWMSMPRGCG